MLSDFLKFFIYINILLYFFLLLWFIIGLFRNKFLLVNPNTYSKKDVSVIICAKNGENQLPSVLNDLMNQEYKGNIEFIIVDDNSNDDTSNIIYDYIKKDKRFRYSHSRDGSRHLNYKKRALDAGIKASKYDYLIFSDVGCILDRHWVSSIMNNYIDEINYVIGLSFVHHPKNITSQFQKIDLFMLMLAMLSSMKLNYPLASSGQNLSYKKDLFKSMDGFKKISHLMMGDDSIFMQMGLRHNIIRPCVALDPGSFVKSRVIYNWIDLFKQRIRWAGDGIIMWKYNKYFYFIMLITFLTNLFYFLAPFIFYKYIKFLIIIFSIKFLIELVLYILGSFKVNQEISITYFTLWFFLQIPYIVLVGLFSPFAPYLGWKTQA